MDHLTAMQVFVAVVEERGFSAASQVLGMTLPTVSRKIAELESHLGAQLLTRSTRTVTVTDSGRRYYEDARRILEDLEDAQRQVSGEYQQPKGRLAVTAPTFFGRLHVLPIVNHFLQTYPDIDIQFYLSNYVVDLLEEHINVGIRIGALPDSSIIGIELGTVRQVLCASPGYLSQHGRPASPNDLLEHQCILSFKGGAPADWVFKMPSGRIEHILVQARLTLNSIEGIVDAILQDGGLAQLYSYQVAPHVADGTLEIVLTPYEINPVPVSLVYPQGKFAPQKVRAFIDFVVPRVRECLARIETQSLS
jgi:DNA-binding transcriptional LysR family regulator